MKIAIVIDIYQDTGNGTSMSARRFVSEIKRRGHEVVVLCQGDPSVKEEGVVTFQTLVVPFFQKTIENQHALLAEPDDSLIRKTLTGVDIVHIYLPFWLGTHCARIAAEMGIPALGCYHLSAENITFNAGLKHFSLATVMTYSFMRNIHYRPEWIQDIHCPSRCIAGTILKYKYRQNLHIISNGYNSDFRPANVERPPELKDKFVITSVGRLTAEKRQDLIIKAIGKTPYKRNIVLFLAGKGPKQAHYQALAKKWGVDLRFVFCTPPELAALHNTSDLFIQASDVETESISCLEAIACGVVPIISNAKMCATKQFALSNRSLFTKGQSGSLKRRIMFWYKNPDLLLESKAKYAEFAKKFSIKKSIDSILQVYTDMTERVSRDCYTIHDYNNPLTLTVQIDKDGKPVKKFRSMLKVLARLLVK